MNYKIKGIICRIELGKKYLFREFCIIYKFLSFLRWNMVVGNFEVVILFEVKILKIRIYFKL